MTSEAKFIDHHGVRLHYLDEGKGLPVLLLHAYPMNSAMFRPQLSALGGKYRFIVPDHRGFGKSGLSGDATEMATIAEDALAILDALHISEAVVGGVSMGGYAAMALVRRAPQRVKGLILADTQATADDDAGRAKREAAAKAALSGGVRAVADAMLPLLLSPEAPTTLRAQVEENILANSKEGAAAAQRGMQRRPDSGDVLAEYTGPSLVLVGEKDGVTPPAKAQQMASRLRKSTLVTIPAAGHLSNLEAPDAFNRALDTFLAGLR